MLQDFNNDFSREIWETTYKAPQDNKLEDTLNRVAITCASIEKEEIRQKISKDFKYILSDFKFVPGGRILSNLGVKGRESVTLYNCFTHNPIDIGLKDPDSLSGIYDLLKSQALILKSEGGYGMNSSFLRPEGSYVEGIGGRTPGMLKFLELWDKSSEIITAGSDKIVGERNKNEKNKIRKGAQMVICGCWHPEIEEFVISKQTPNRLTKFNMSVALTNDFMNAVVNNENWNLIFPDTKFEKYKLEWNGDIEEWKNKKYPIIIHKTIKAKDLWEKIMSSTYNRAEPGCYFIDNTFKLNPLWYADKPFQTNPCGEIPMGTGVCNLGSLNLTKFIKIQDNKVYFDYEEFKNCVKIAIRFLDNINDISKTPLIEFDISVKQKRRIGLGVMGLGSLHYILGIKFGGQESLQLLHNIFKLKSETEILSSAELGKEKGSFLLFDKEKYFNSYWWNNINISKEIKDTIESIGCMRNSHHSMNAPTGNTGVYAECVSGGIEPVYSKEYYRWSIVSDQDKINLKKQGLEFPNPLKGEWFETKDFKFSKRGIDEILKGKFNNINYEIDKSRGLIKSTLIEDFGWRFAKIFYKDNLEKMKDIFVTTSDLSVNDHINTLKIISHYTNQACSKTVNIPNNYNYDDFKNLYLDAWKSGIKGITTYREGTMNVVLEKKQEEELHQTIAPKRPRKLEGEIHHFSLNNKKYYVAVGLYGKDKNPYEIFTGINQNKKEFFFPKDIKTGKIEKRSRGKYVFIDNENEEYNLMNGHSDDTADALTRILSCSLRHGAPLQHCVHQLEKVGGPIISFSKILSRTLKKYIKNGIEVSGEDCPQCKSKLIRQEGCKICSNCSYSACN